MNSEKITEAEIKLAAIREWLKQEHKNMSYFQIVDGIKNVLDWSMDAQKRDETILRAADKNSN